MKARLLVAAACLLAGCDAGGNRAAETDQIERLSRPQNVTVPSGNPAGLLPLTPEDLAGEDYAGAPCAFTADGRLLLAASGEGALARLEDGLRHLVPSGPVGPSGGYFEERQVSVSIGRDADGEGAARARVTHRRAEAQEDIMGDWTCRTAG